jgi:hypothetical protein
MPQRGDSVDRSDPAYKRTKETLPSSLPQACEAARGTSALTSATSPTRSARKHHCPGSQRPSPASSRAARGKAGTPLRKYHGVNPFPEIPQRGLCGSFRSSLQTDERNAPFLTAVGLRSRARHERPHLSPGSSQFSGRRPQLRGRGAARMDCIHSSLSKICAPARWLDLDSPRFHRRHSPRSNEPSPN